MSPIPEKVLEKLAKIKALVDGATTDGELQAATNKMNKILLEYNISISEVEFDSKDDLKVDELPLDALDIVKKNEGKWVTSLYGVLARHNLCRVILSQGPVGARRGRYVKGVTKIHIFGSPTNIEIVQYMASAIMSQLRNMEPRYWSKYQRSPEAMFGGSKRGAFRRAWYLGAVHGINEQLAAQVRNIVNDNPGMNALIKVHDAAVNTYIDNKFGRLQKGRSAKVSSGAGYSSGREAGKNLSLNKGVGSGNTGGATVLGQKRLGG